MPISMRRRERLYKAVYDKQGKRVLVEGWGSQPRRIYSVYVLDLTTNIVRLVDSQFVKNNGAWYQLGVDEERM